MATTNPHHVSPVFIRNSSLPAFEEKEYSTSEICSAAEKSTGYQTIHGAQRINGLWRLYPTTAEARQKLLISGLNLRGIHVTVSGNNPFIIVSPNGTEEERETTKVIVGNVPISFSDDEILKAMRKFLDCEPRSKLILERDRDANGKLTRWVTGRRILYIAIPNTPLPRMLQIGIFKATIYHREQKTQATCGRCLQKGHQTRDCKDDVKCRQCFQTGHRAGDECCSLVPPTNSSQSTHDDRSSAMQPPPPPPPSSTTKEPASRQTNASRSPRGRSRIRKPIPTTDPKQRTLLLRSSSTPTKRDRSPVGDSPSQLDKQARLMDTEPDMSKGEHHVQHDINIQT